jgi:hypothetical protein
MENKEEILKKIRILKIVHLTIFLLFIPATISLIFPSQLTLYFATAILFVAATQVAYKGKCHLTLEDKKLREKIGDSAGDDQFVIETLKQYCHIHISRRAVTFVLSIIFIGAGIYMVNYFLEIFTRIL